MTGESLNHKAAVLMEENLAWLPGRDIRSLQQLCAEAEARFPTFPACRAALDIALHKAFAQYSGVPLMK